MRRVAHLDLPGSGQVVVQGRYASLVHMDPPHGTTIVDVSDPKRPRVVAGLTLDDPHEHSHKVRVVGDIMYTNVERPSRRFAAKATRLERTPQTNDVETDARGLVYIVDRNCGFDVLELEG
jgi:hypothetical protein